ncbi:MAG: molecular chaperone DnaK [Deltaproteobacteria bacterium]|nr:molecular chaperone DnaK [Deltaproteobacteria bacterium]
MAGDVIIGIDLGTTNSVVAIVDGDVPKIVPNRLGQRLTPSMVAISENNKRLLGHLAKRQAITNPENTVYGAKRLIGRKWNTPAVAKALETLTYTCKEGPHNDVRILLRGKDYSVPEISAMVLQEMRTVAEDYLGHPVEKAVVTVPAYFNDGQRQATKDAGKIAGLDVVRIINEPTAAALAYGYGKEMKKKVAVYDLGGGTFDISVLEINSGVFEVLATSGDTFLGGDDFDHRIIDWLVFAFAKENKVDLRKDKMALQRLRDAAEKAKMELSTVQETELNLPFIYTAGKETFHIQKKLTRDKFTELCADLVERTVHITKRTIGEARINVQDLDDVILVGGMTRMPAVQQAVEKFFGKAPSKGVHPDEVVALGASIQGSLLGQAKSEMLLLDVTPHALGIMVAGGFFKPLIEKNTTVPTSKAEVFTTVRDGQTQVRIMVMQGESQLAEENELLGEFVLEGLREARRGEVKIQVNFEISADGILSVAATNLESGRAQAITVTATSGLTEHELQDMVKDAQQYAVAQRTSTEFEGDRVEAERVIREIERLMPTVQAKLQASSFGTDAIKRAEQSIIRAKDALSHEDREALLSSMEGLKKTLEMLRGVASKA